VLKLRRQLSSEAALNAELHAELKAVRLLVRDLQYQLSAVSGGELVPADELKAAQWAQRAAQRETASLRSELDAVQAHTHAKHEKAVESLLWLEREARSGKAALAELELVGAQLRATKTRAESLEVEVATLRAEVNRLRRRGAGVIDERRRVSQHASGAAAGAVAAAQPRSPVQVLPVEDAINRYTRSAVGTRARLTREAQRLAARQEEMSAAQRDLDARAWLAAVDRKVQLGTQHDVDAQYAAALQRLAEVI
jgi:hypothetical protein